MYNNIVFHLFQSETSQSLSTCLLAESSKVYKKEPLTKYKQQINKAAFVELSIENPTSLCDRNALLTSARKRVHDSGYEYKKGKSHSFDLDQTIAIKQQKIDFSTRTKQLSGLQQRLDTIDQCIKMKQNRCQENEMNKNYKICDELMSEISTLLLEKQLIETDAFVLKRKEKIEVVL